MFERVFRWTTSTLALAVLLGSVQAVAAQTSLTILHNNDGESNLRGDDEFGGVARFKALVDELRTDAAADGRGVIMLSSGDNYLAGPDNNASVTDPQGATSTPSPSRQSATTPWRSAITSSTSAPTTWPSSSMPSTRRRLSEGGDHLHSTRATRTHSHRRPLYVRLF